MTKNNQKYNIKKRLLMVFGGIVIIFVILGVHLKGALCVTPKKETKFCEISYPTPNCDSNTLNKLEGVILHHTAETTIEKSLAILSSPEKKVGTHVVIDSDGTRYIMASPETVTYHAGFSLLNGKEGCNYFTLGIEFQGNTLINPLTNEQIESAIEYLIPIISKYHISLKNIVTHEMVRNAYKMAHPEKKCNGKVDITRIEYLRFIRHLKKAINETPS